MQLCQELLLTLWLSCLSGELFASSATKINSYFTNALHLIVVFSHLQEGREKIWFVNLPQACAHSFLWSSSTSPSWQRNKKKITIFMMKETGKNLNAKNFRTPCQKWEVEFGKKIFQHLLNLERGTVFEEPNMFVGYSFWGAVFEEPNMFCSIILKLGYMSLWIQKGLRKITTC